LNQLYDIFKSFIDPVFIVFVLLLICFVFCLIEGKKKKTILLLLITIVLLYGMSIQPVSNYLIYHLEKDYINNAVLENKTKLDVIVVLGGGVSDIKSLKKTFAVEETIARLFHAVRMYKHHHAEYLVCSGKGLEQLSNAVVMAQMAEEMGVPRGKIKIEPNSANTYEHAVEFNKIFQGKDIKIGLVTSAYHMKRSEKAFKKFFKNVMPLPSSFLYASLSKIPIIRYIPQSHHLSNNTLVLHEYVGQIWYAYKVRG